MAERLPKFEIPGRTRWPRDWQSYDGYQVVHASNMRALEREYLVRRDSTRFYETFNADELIQVNVKGRVITWSRAHVRVNKWLEVSSEHGQLRVRTREYAYHANLRLNGEWQDLFRYDNCHGGLGTLHRHEFDSAGEQVQVSETAPDEMPPLAIVIR